MAFKFELVDEEPSKNVLFYQIQEMKLGEYVDKDLIERLEPFILSLDEETAKKVDECNRGTEWFSHIESDEGKLDARNQAIINFLNARRSYRSRKARGSVKKVVDNPESSAS